MKTALKLSPADHGRPMTNIELAAADFVQGYKYEVIEGGLYVSLEPDLPEDRVADWLHFKVKLYSLQRPDVLNYVTQKGRVFVPSRRRETIPEPDLTAYRDFPLDLPLGEVNWPDVSPILVAEVYSGGDPYKDLSRNVRLYLRVPTVREYWIINISEDPERPSMLVYRRRGRSWQNVIDIAFSETYTTKLLPGFTLLLDPRK